MSRLRLGLLFFLLAQFFPPATARAQQRTQPTPTAQPPSAAPDLSKLTQEAQEWLAGLIRINTTNPPGNELEAARYIAAILQREAISAEVFESAPGRGIVIARLQAGAIPNPSQALLLLGHTDVVGVDRDKWTTDPFGAEVKSGYLYGRGAIDDKGPLIANLAVLVALKRSGAPLARDVIFLAEGDEEAGGDAGIAFAILQHWDKIAAGFAINEGGRTVRKDGRILVGVQASEKVPVNVHVIASGPAGHASIPIEQNAVNHLAAAVAKIAAYHARPNPQTVVLRYFERLSAISDPELAKWMRALDQPGRAALAAERIAQANPVWNAMLRNTVSPTMLQAGVRVNVIPSEARASLNIRLLPGESIDALVEELKKLVNDPQVRFEVDTPSRMPSPPSSVDSDLFRTVERVAPQFFPDSIVLPELSTWATDSAQLRAHNVQAYGMNPFPLTEEDLARMHSDDERIPLDAFRRGIEFLYRIVSEFVRSR